MSVDTARKSACATVVSLLLLAPGYAQHTQPVEQRIFQAINQIRQENKLPALKWNPKIADAARSHSRRMATKRFFSHEDPEFGGPGNRLSAAGIAWQLCGENIFEEYGESDPVQSAVRGWMHSAGHRKNILTRGFTHTGLGVAIGHDGTYAITQMFAAF
ncbi:MAG TPA: CAP domain-containing protein [Bryobacteraceae bacterium]|nr:CAP domain-containing protein [Bryobacteraceae bacterium]